MTQKGWVGFCLGIALLVPAAVRAQSDELPLEIGGLLRTGFHAEPESTGEPDGFDIFDARLKLSGEVGIVFDYFLQTEYDADEEAFELLDAYVGLPVIPQLEIQVGLHRPRFGLEALQTRGDLTFLERSQASTAIAPGRQVGVQAVGEAFDGRLTYGGGIFNGNGTTLQNDGDDYMFAGRIQFNSIGTIAFYEDLVVQGGLSLAHSDDTLAPLGVGSVTGDPGGAPELTTAFAGSRLLFGADVKATYRGWSLTAEYLRADYDLDESVGGGPPAEADAYGGYVELGYRFWGALEGVARYDGFQPALGDNRDFLVLGVNVYPGYYAKFGVQYAVGLDESPDAPTLADGQFLLVAQVDF